jgi:hypothetical protein
MTITALPTPPSRSDPANFAARGDAFMAALPTFATEANALAVTMDAAAAAAAASAASAAAAVAAAINPVTTLTASASAALEFTSLATGYDYRIEMEDITPATNGVNLQLQVSTDNGSTWKSGASDYLWSLLSNHSSTATASGATSSGAVAQLVLAQSISNSSADGVSGTIRIKRPNVTSNAKKLTTEINSCNSSSQRQNIRGAGTYAGSTTAVNAVRLIMSGGNIASGIARLYRTPL